jgi:hypothetical protein
MTESIGELKAGENNQYWQVKTYKSGANGLIGAAGYCHV